MTAEQLSLMNKNENRWNIPQKERQKSMIIPCMIHPWGYFLSEKCQWVTHVPRLRGSKIYREMLSRPLIYAHLSIQIHIHPLVLSILFYI
jgi:hypothetical protein